MRLSRILGHSLKSPPDRFREPPPAYDLSQESRTSSLPRLNVVIQVIGSHGDVQPFVAIGTALQQHRHRVRIATHARFRPFVEDAGLEFFDIGGDPAALMSYMVRNPGLLPKLDSVIKGEIQSNREMMQQIMKGCWRSCIEAEDGYARSAVADSGQRHCSDPKAFVADAIIANPPSFAHIHCAEKLGIPLHMMFTLVSSSFPGAFSTLKTNSKKHALVTHRCFRTSIGQYQIDEPRPYVCQLPFICLDRDHDMARHW